MYDRLKYLYESGRLTATQLDIAVSKGWITELEKNQILNPTA